MDIVLGFGIGFILAIAVGIALVVYIAKHPELWWPRR
jgi:hypothetical protein